jgi:hypothetical protein
MLVAIMAIHRSQEGPLSFLGGHIGDMEDKEHFMTSLRLAI